MGNTRKPKKPSLREQARQAKPRTEHYDIPLVDHDEAVEAGKALVEAKRDLDIAERMDTDVDKARAACEAAQARWDECFRRVTFTGLPVKQVDELVNSHGVDYLYHLAEASCVNGEDMTAEDWKDLCENVWPSAQTQEFMLAVANASQRPYSEGIPKG